MTTACSAAISPANDPGDGTFEPAGSAGANRIAATTTARKAAHFTAVVTSWNRLLTRRPASWRAANPASATIDTTFSYPTSAGSSSAANSPIAIDTYPRTAQ